jgi:peptidyl-prolyl cis-trans isomerase C
MYILSKPPVSVRFVKFGGSLALAAAILATPLAYADDAKPAAAAPAAAVAAAVAPKPTDVVATVGADKITEADLGYAAEDLGQQLQSVPPEQQKSFLTTVLIDMKIMAAGARAQKLDATDDYKGRLAYLEDRALRRAYFEQEVAAGITPDVIKAAYDQYVKTFVPQDQIHARHILVKTEDEAKAIETQLAGGAKFEDIAKAKSTDTGSGANGGDLGVFGHGQMVKPFEDAAFALKVGEISQPVQSQFGWHIIRVDEIKKTAPAPFEQISQQLQQQILFKKFDETVAALKKTTPVVIPDATLAAQVAAQEAAAAPGAPAPAAGQ